MNKFHSPTGRPQSNIWSPSWNFTCPGRPLISIPAIYDIHVPVYGIYVPVYDIHIPVYDIHIPVYDIHVSVYYIHVPEYYLHVSVYYIHVPEYYLHVPVYDIHIPVYDIHVSVYYLHVPEYYLHVPVYYNFLRIQRDGGSLLKLIQLSLFKNLRILFHNFAVNFKLVTIDYCINCLIDIKIIGLTAQYYMYIYWRCVP